MDDDNSKICKSPIPVKYTSKINTNLSPVNIPFKLKINKESNETKIPIKYKNNNKNNLNSNKNLNLEFKNNSKFRKKIDNNLNSKKNNTSIINQFKDNYENKELKYSKSRSKLKNNIINSKSKSKNIKQNTINRDKSNLKNKSIYNNTVKNNKELSVISKNSNEIVDKYETKQKVEVINKPKYNLERKKITPKKNVINDKKIRKDNSIINKIADDKKYNNKLNNNFLDKKPIPQFVKPLKKSKILIKFFNLLLKNLFNKKIFNYSYQKIKLNYELSNSKINRIQYKMNKIALKHCFKEIKQGIKKFKNKKKKKFVYKFIKKEKPNDNKENIDPTPCPKPIKLNTDNIKPHNIISAPLANESPADLSFTSIKDHPKVFSYIKYNNNMKIFNTWFELIIYNHNFEENLILFFKKRKQKWIIKSWLSWIPSLKKDNEIIEHNNRGLVQSFQKIMCYQKIIWYIKLYINNK